MVEFSSYKSIENSVVGTVTTPQSLRFHRTGFLRQSFLQGCISIHLQHWLLISYYHRFQYSWSKQCHPFGTSIEPEQSVNNSLLKSFSSGFVACIKSWNQYGRHAISSAYAWRISFFTWFMVACFRQKRDHHLANTFQKSYQRFFQFTV